MRKKTKALKCGRDYVWVLEAKMDNDKWYPQPSWGNSERSKLGATNMARKKLRRQELWMKNHFDFTGRIRFKKYIKCNDALESLLLEDGFGFMAHAIGDYMKTKGWSIQVISSPSITAGKNMYNFNLTFNFTGSKIKSDNG